ncbi:MAG: amidase, partial [Actinomycetota bacterium]|nr:amidase [Actinomycetota bacterium]
MPGAHAPRDAIARTSRTLNAFITVHDDAREGVPLAVKDLLDTAGRRTTYGSAIFREHVPERTAEAVVSLEQGGYAVVGKTNLHEFAYGITSENEHFGAVRNPLDAARIPGGSSGGSAAALAARMCDAALGTDSGGSIRLPAACCGVVGFKPTFGLVPTHGVFPLAPTFDHVGPMARTVAGCVATMERLAPGIVPPLTSLEHVSVGVAWLEHADELVRRRVGEAASAFPRRRAVEFPLPTALGPAFMREVADVHRDLFAAHRELYGTDVRTKVERCLALPDTEARRSQDAREAYRDEAREALAGVDLLLVPTMTSVAPPVGIGDLALREGMVRLTLPFNALGWPALALPCGPAEGGLPASLQLVGRAGADDLVLAAGLALE